MTRPDMHQMPDPNPERRGHPVVAVLMVLLVAALLVGAWLAVRWVL